jgi:asparagine synthase (glutamine-hydrolysing)
MRENLQPWLRPDVLRAHLWRVAQDQASEPLSRSAAITWAARRRVAVVAARSRALVAADHDVQMLDPLLHPDVVAALAAHAGFWGWRGRTSALRAMVSDLLPAAVIERQSKALFNTAYFGDASRDFALRWDGTGIDQRLVDPDLMRQEWLASAPSALTFLPLQAAWLAGQSEGAAA